MTPFDQVFVHDTFSEQVMLASSAQKRLLDRKAIVIGAEDSEAVATEVGLSHGQTLRFHADVNQRSYYQNKLINQRLSIASR